MKAKRIFYNIISGLFAQLITIALGFLIPRLFLLNFGSEINGIVNTIQQIFSYLWLLEAGVGLAALQSLYFPVSQNNHSAINAVLSAADLYYRKTGILYFVIVVLFAVLYASFVDTVLPPASLFLIIMLQGIPSVLSYLIQGKYRLLLEAEGKSYFLNALTSASQFIISLGKVLLLMLTHNLILVHCVQLFSSILILAILLIYMKRHYPWLNIRGTAPDFQSVSSKSSVLIHQISGVIFNNTDVILLSVFCNFKIVSVYTTYNLFFSYAERLITTVTSGITFSLGQLFHTDRQRFALFQDAYETCYMCFVFIIYTMVYLFILPVIRLYTRGITDINYIDTFLPLLFVLLNLFANGKLPSNQVINFAGHFSATKSHAILEVAINLIVSVIAIQFFGIYGGLLGTIAALLYRGNIMIFYSNHKILKQSAFVTYKKWLINLLVFFSIIQLASLHSPALSSYGRIFLWCIPYGICITAVYVTVNCITQPKFTRFVCRTLKERLKKL